jgi:hypothetical protein
MSGVLGLVGDAPRPVAGKSVLERFRLAYSLIAIAVHVLDQRP